MTTHTETMWAIAGRNDLYDATNAKSRSEAITHYCWDQHGWLTSDDWFCRGRLWARARYNGDRAVKVTITYEYPDEAV